jgi:hypothetical protein
VAGGLHYTEVAAPLQPPVVTAAGLAVFDYPGAAFFKRKIKFIAQNNLSLSLYFLSRIGITKKGRG